METFKVVTCPTTESSHKNKAILNPQDTFAQFEHIAVRYPKKSEAFVFSVDVDNKVRTGCIAFNVAGRKWASLMSDSVIEAAPYKFEPKSQCLNTITFTADFVNRGTANVNQEFDSEEMAKQFSQKFYNQAFTVGQLFAYCYQYNNKSANFELKVKELEAVDIAGGESEVGTLNVEIGLTTANTVIMFEPAEGSPIKLVGGKTGKSQAPQLFNQNWDFANMGVGGVSEQFNKIFRRAFATRLLPPNFVKELEFEQVRGILLYGPPGTGKTLIARQIGKMLLAREPKIVNGPEVLNKYVGESEANIRKLFQDAEEEQAKAGLNSGLHMIIFDEIDAICKARGSSASSSGVGDNVVNQLLSKIDGVNALTNVLLIGMTNRRDLIDEALLRPGRLEVQIEIGLPNEEGRVEIFKIHTKKMREKGILDSTVSLEELAAVTKNFSGAEIAGLVKAAQSLAVNRVVKPDSKEAINEKTLAMIKVTREDFEFAMKHDIKPALGASEDQLMRLALPIIQWDPIVEALQSRIKSTIQQITQRDVQRRRPYYVLLVGAPGTGLTTLAANMAIETKFPFIRVYQAKATANETESAKVQYMKKLFDDAARSEQSCIVIDGLEDILDYCHIGPRFSNTSRAVFKGNRDTALGENKKMLVICTCSSEPSLNDLQLWKTFNKVLYVPSITTPTQVKNVLNTSEIFHSDQIDQLVEKLDSIPFQMGVKELENLIENVANEDPERQVDMFLQEMHNLKLVKKPSIDGLRW